MNRNAIATALSAGLLLLGTCGSAAWSATHNRSAEWVTGFTQGSSAGNPVNGMWKYEYVTGGDGLADADPWWDNAGTLCVWDDSWWGQPGGAWDRADNTNPPIQQNGLTHTIDGGSYPHRPRVSWICPAESTVSVSGALDATWGGGATQNLEVAIGKIAGKDHSLLLSGTLQQGGPTSLAVTGAAVQYVDMSAGDMLVLTTRAVAAQAGWVPLNDSGMTITTVPLPLGKGGLVGHWTFDDPADVGKDASGRGNHGAVHEAVQSANVPAQIGAGSSLSFDGANDHVSVPGLAGPTNAFTIAFWLNPESHTNYNQTITTGGWDKFNFHTTNTGEVYVGVVQGGNWGSRFTPADLPAGTVALNQWQHFAFTYDNGTASFFKDGQRLAYKTGMDLPSAWTGLSIGTGAGNTLHGLADDVAVWNGALHGKTVHALARGWISPSDKYAQAVLNDNPMAYWRLDDAPGSTVARDLTGKHDGVYSGSVILGRGGTHSEGSPTNAAAEFAGGSMTAGTIDGLRDNFSVEFWIHPDTHTNYNQSIGGDGGWNQFNFHTGNSGEIWVGTGCCGNDRRFTNGDLPAGTFQLGEWQYFVFTFDEVDDIWGEASFYKNGQLLARRNLRKGAAWTGFNLRNDLDGLLDELAVYDYALSPDQILAHWFAAVPEPATLALLALAAAGLGGYLRRRT